MPRTLLELWQPCRCHGAKILVLCGAGGEGLGVANFRQHVSPGGIHPEWWSFNPHSLRNMPFGFDKWIKMCVPAVAAQKVPSLRVLLALCFPLFFRDVGDYFYFPVLVTPPFAGWSQMRNHAGIRLLPFSCMHLPFLLVSSWLSGCSLSPFLLPPASLFLFLISEYYSNGHTTGDFCICYNRDSKTLLEFSF